MLFRLFRKLLPDRGLFLRLLLRLSPGKIFFPHLPKSGDPAGFIRDGGIHLRNLKHHAVQTDAAVVIPVGVPFFLKQHGLIGKDKASISCL